MKKITHILFLSLIIFSSCKKEKLPEENLNSSEPVFYIKCYINGIQARLFAGVEDYYMNSSYYLDTSNVYVYKAELAQKSCSNNCGYSIAVLINDYKISVGNSTMDVSNGIKSGTYSFYQPDKEPALYKATFTPQQAVSADNNYSWKIDNVLISNTYETTLNMNTGEKYSVTFISDNKCATQHSTIFDVGNPLQAAITASLTDFDPRAPLLKYKFWSDVTGYAPYSYYWDFGDGVSSDEVSPEHIYARTGRYTAMLRLINANKDTCISYYQVAASFQNECDANFKALFVPIIDTKALSEITILITDSNGKVYSSKDAEQPVSSKFEIIEVENYKTNEKSEPTKKIKIKFNCVAKSGNNQINISNGEAVLAVSYE